MQGITAVAVCCHRSEGCSGGLRPHGVGDSQLSKQWSIEGGSLTKPFGLDVKEIDSAGGPLSFVRIDKNADWLLKTLFGKVAKGSLRRSSIFRTLETILQKYSPLSPEHAQESSPSSAVADTSSPTVADTSSPAVADSEPVDPCANWRRPAASSRHPRKRGKALTNRSAGRTKSKLPPCQSTSLYPTQAGRKSGWSDCFPSARTRCGCVSMTFLGS